MEDTLPVRVRLGVFEVDLRAGELRSGGRNVRLQEQPFQILLMLIERGGETVTRDEIQKKLWPNDTVVEWDHSINAAIKKLRYAFGDSADSPEYIETVARRGYRLLISPTALSANGNDGTHAKPAWQNQNEEPNGNAVDLGLSRQPVPPVRENERPANFVERRRWNNGSLIGKEVSHYRVLEVIGGGGMGMVYKAEDLKLGRQVALKFLPDEMAWDPIVLQRFEREARTASLLDHPNICTIYEVEEHEEQPFLVMPLLKGETLRDRLAAVASKHQTMPVDEVLEIAIQICAGLEAAHERGIIHRDIKPANIFLTSSGQVKILDFGLAKLESASREAESDGLCLEADGTPAAAGPARATEPDATLTCLGIAMGTAGYMSPEQVRGEKLDGRSDIFSFGLVLYEMATGERAFTGESATAIRDAILQQIPVAARATNASIPPKLQAVIDRAIEKNRDQRYQKASELRIDLRVLRAEMNAPTASAVPERGPNSEVQGSAALSPAIQPRKAESATPGRRHLWIIAALLVVLAAGIGVAYHFTRTQAVQANATIAVLPFTDMSPGHDEEYFSDGLTEQLIDDLASVPGLNVVGRSSASQFKGKNVSPRTTGRALNVANILQGSVWKDGDRVRITAELTKVSDGFQLWSHTYDRQIGDIFAVQDEIARDVARELRLKLTGANGFSPGGATATTTPEAYQAYLLGKYFFRHDDEPGDCNKALVYADETVKLDPKYAPGWALRAMVLSRLAEFGAIDNAQGHRDARHSAQTAIVLDPNLADGYLALARMQVYYDFDLGAAAAGLAKAGELAPGNGEVYVARANVAKFLGHFDQAMELDKKALALDPLYGHGMMGSILYDQRRYEEAQAALHKALELNPNLPIVHYLLGVMLLAQKHPDEGLEEMRQERGEAFRLLGLVLAYDVAGRHPESDAALNELIAKHPKDDPYLIATAYAYRNEVGTAFLWLERAYERRDGALLNLKTDPLLTSLHTDPRYGELLHKMNL